MWNNTEKKEPYKSSYTQHIINTLTVVASSLKTVDWSGGSVDGFMVGATVGVTSGGGSVVIPR